MITEPICAGKRCLVVGSAPGVKIPPRGEFDVLLAANGGAAIARDRGYSVDVLVTTSYLFRANRSGSENKTVRSMRGVAASTVLVDVLFGSVPTSLVANFGIDYQRFREVPPIERNATTAAACGEVLRVSSGVWAACLAVVSGARLVRLVGINPRSNGHEGQSGNAQRDHVWEDVACLDALRRKYGEAAVQDRSTDTDKRGVVA